MQDESFIPYQDAGWKEVWSQDARLQGVGRRHEVGYFHSRTWELLIFRAENRMKDSQNSNSNSQLKFLKYELHSWIQRWQIPSSLVLMCQHITTLQRSFIALSFVQVAHHKWEKSLRRPLSFPQFHIARGKSLKDVLAKAKLEKLWTSSSASWRSHVQPCFRPP